LSVPLEPVYNISVKHATFGMVVFMLRLMRFSFSLAIAENRIQWKMLGLARLRFENAHVDSHSK